MPARKLTVALTVGVGATLVVSEWALTRHVGRVLEDERRRELEVVSRQVRAIATGLSLELGARRAAVVASEGLEAAYPGRWRWLDLAEAARQLEPGEAALLERGELVVRGPVVLAALPRGQDGARLVLELTDSPSDLDDERAASARTLLLVTLGGIGIVSSIAAALGHLLVTRPLRRLAAFVKAVEDGDLTSRLPANGTGEVVALERALNHLSQRLAETDRSLKEQAEAAARAAQDLRRADRLASVGKLSAGLAHELGTPLNVILVRAKALARGPGEPAEVTRQASIIATQAERLIAIVRSLLDFSRRRPPHLAPTDLGDVVRGVVTLLEPQAKTAEVVLRAEVAAPLPRLRADAGQLEQVLTNLVMNAIQASPGGGDVTVRCATARAAPPADAEGRRSGAPAGPVDAVRVDVVDHGGGIRRDDLPLLFEPFFTTKQPGEGTGLGLSVAWGIVREHGGWIEVDSREAEGSRFSVFLPVAAPAESAT